MEQRRVLTARHFATGEWTRIELDGSRLREVCRAPSDAPPSDLDPWVAPAFWDLQVNGRWGVSFSDSTITPEQVVRIAEAQARMGTSRFCPTLITASRESTLAGVRSIAEACDRSPITNHQVLGIHLEGPWISPIDGYRGAHPRDNVRDPDWNEFRELQDASGDRIRLVTLAPERPGAMDFLRRLVQSDVKVAIGHSAAEPDLIDEAIALGLSLITHLGNGVPAILPRHPNILWSLASKSSLWTSFIADGQHVDRRTLAFMMKWRRRRSFIVSDASPLAGSEPGLYGPWEVRDDGRIVVAGTPYLAGSNGTMLGSVENLIRWVPFSARRAIDAATVGPARALGMVPPRIATGEPADLVLLRWNTPEVGREDDRALQLLGTIVQGECILPHSVEKRTAPED